jgi:hypothetical protein
MAETSEDSMEAAMTTEGTMDSEAAIQMGVATTEADTTHITEVAAAVAVAAGMPSLQEAQVEVAAAVGAVTTGEAHTASTLTKAAASEVSEEEKALPARGPGEVTTRRDLPLPRVPAAAVPAPEDLISKF